MTPPYSIARLLTAAFVLAASSAFAADDGNWTVSKSSGEVWLTNSGAQPASLKQEEFLKPGDTIRTGKNGRVLLKRGEESMMIAPNSVVGVPAEKKEGLSTTIVQQAGSILLDVEKRNVKHFEVETPYLAAVVKGTQFRVSVNAGSTSVEVIRGQVEVADFRTGQIAQVMPGQHATTFANGKGGLSLGGSGTFSPIEQGKPRTPSIERVPVPRAGLTAPRNTAVGQAVQSPGNGARAVADKASDKGSHRASGVNVARHGGIRISSAIGEVKLNVHKVTHGLARDKSAGHGGGRSASNKDTIWGSSGAGTNSAASTGNSSTIAATSAGAATSTGTSAASSGTTTTTTVAVVNGSGNGGGGGNGNGNNGNGNGNGGANGDGKTNNRYGDKHTDNGNGNGNGNGHGRK